MVAFMLNAYHGRTKTTTTYNGLYLPIMLASPALKQQKNQPMVRPDGDEGFLAPSLLYSKE